MTDLPARIGPYRVTHKLGEGGMGVVYAAVDEKLNRPIAVKTIRDAGADTPTRERFWREARAAAAVSHPNICQLYEIDEDGDQLFLVMELLEGQPLSEKLHAGPVSPHDALVLGLRVNRHRFPDALRAGPLRARPTGIATEPAAPGAPV